MAYSSQTAPVSSEFSLRSALIGAGKALGGILERLSHAMIVNSSAQQRLDYAERLRAKSDAELAEMGIKRDDIVRYVFRDLYWM